MKKTGFCTVGFCTAVKYYVKPSSKAEVLLEKVDDYFYFGGRRAIIIELDQQQKNKEAIISYPKYHLSALKVLSYFTFIIPIIAFFAKVILRCAYSFNLKELNPSIHNLIESDTEIDFNTEQEKQYYKNKIIAFTKWYETNKNIYLSLEGNPETDNFHQALANIVFDISTQFTSLPENVQNSTSVIEIEKFLIFNCFRRFFAKFYANTRGVKIADKKVRYEAAVENIDSNITAKFPFGHPKLLFIKGLFHQQNNASQPLLDGKYLDIWGDKKYSNG